MSAHQKLTPQSAQDVTAKRAKPTIATLLMQAADLIEPEGCWVPRGTLNDGGHAYDVTHEKAHAWSGECAIYRVHDLVSFGGSKPILDFADEAVRGCFSVWERQTGRTQSQVVEALRRAALLASDFASFFVVDDDLADAA